KIVPRKLISPVTYGGVPGSRVAHRKGTISPTASSAQRQGRPLAVNRRSRGASAAVANTSSMSRPVSTVPLLAPLLAPLLVPLLVLLLESVEAHICQRVAGEGDLLVAGDRRQRPGEVGGQRRPEIHHGVCDRVTQAQPRRVEKVP